MRAAVVRPQQPSRSPPILPSRSAPTPWGIAVDEATDTIYTANPANCGTRHRLGDQRRHLQRAEHERLRPDARDPPAGFGSQYVTVDQRTNQVYTTNLLDSSVTTINGNTCKGSSTGGCARTRTDASVGPSPGGIAVDPSVDTAYVADNEGVSVLPLNR